MLVGHWYSIHFSAQWARSCKNSRTKKNSRTWKQISRSWFFSRSWNFLSRFWKFFGLEFLHEPAQCITFSLDPHWWTLQLTIEHIGRLHRNIPTKCTSFPDPAAWQFVFGVRCKHCKRSFLSVCADCLQGAYPGIGCGIPINIVSHALQIQQL